MSCQGKGKGEGKGEGKTLGLGLLILTWRQAGARGTMADPTNPTTLITAFIKYSFSPLSGSLKALNRRSRSKGRWDPKSLGVNFSVEGPLGPPTVEGPRSLSESIFSTARAA